MDYRFVVLIILVFFLMVSYQQVSALSIIFPTLGYRADNPPTYCLLSPEGTSPVPHFIKGRYVYLFQEAVYEWSAKLQAADPQNNKLWEMNVEEIPKDETIIGKNCDIPVRFEFRDSQTLGYVGQFRPSVVVQGVHTPSIMMHMDGYYSGTDKCAPTYSTNILCDDGYIFRSEGAFFSTAKHEIGHSLGLGHYTSDDDELNTKWHTTLVSPSIMIPGGHSVPSMRDITNGDLQKVQSIYGQEGFYAFSAEAPPSIFVPPPTEEPPTGFLIPTIPKQPVFPFETVSLVNTENEDLSGKKIVTGSNQVPTMVKISGTIYESEFNRGQPVYLLIIKPDDTSETQKIRTTNKGYFETLLIFDRDSPLGEYRVQTIYLENTDGKMDIFFEVVDKINKESTQVSPTSQETLLEKQKQETRERLERIGWKNLEGKSTEEMLEMEKRMKVFDEIIELEKIEQETRERLERIGWTSLEGKSTEEMLEMEKNFLLNCRTNCLNPMDFIENKHTETFVLKKKVEVDFFSEIISKIQDFFAGLGWG